MLQTFQEQCLEWARRHRALFALEKYIIVHFTRARTKHNHSCPLTLPTSLINSSPSAHVLGVILDKKLSWQPCLHHIKSNLATQIRVHSRLIASTWGASLQVFRLLYTAVVRPAIPIGCPLWWAPPSTPLFRSGLGDKLQRVNNHGLKTISSSYKAIQVQSLQADMGVPLLSLYMDDRQA